MNYFKDLLKKQKELDFTQHFYELLEREDDVEIALNVSYELLLFAHHSTEYKLIIDRAIVKDSTHFNIHSWQTNITIK